MMSCNNEELFVEDISINEPTTPEEDTTGTDDTAVPDSVTTPCDFTLDTVQANSTIIINCVMDLEGKTINLPAGVTIVYEGGDIINGTLNFANDDVISGELLNSTLTLTGSKPLLKDPVFNFNPKRWGIVEGETTSEIAQRNNNILESMMLKVKDLGVNTFRIDKMDAYFEVSKVTSTTTNINFYASVEAINIPSDFNLVMTDNTILRVFPPSENLNAALLSIREESNVTIKGGTLYGDRDLRQYSKSNAEEGSHLFTIRSGKNIVLDGIKFKMGSLGGLNINSTGFSFNNDYDPTNNVTVKNCLFEKNRMMSIAITDGRNIIIDNNTFLDTAQPTQFSDGGVVAYAINLEPVRKRDEITNELVYYQRVQDVTIKNNTEKNSRTGSFNIYVGDNIIIENNNIESVVAWSYASNSKIRNNIFKASTDTTRPAIIASGAGETVFNNEISGNQIMDYGTGIAAYHGKLKIFNNDLKNISSGIVLNKVTDMEVYENKISSAKSNSRGITFQITSADNILIKNNVIDVVTNHIKLIDVNQAIGQENNRITFQNNVLSSSAVVQISQTNGLIYNENTSNGRIQISNSSNVELLNSTILSPDGHGVSINNINTNITIKGNTIEKPENFQCIYFRDGTDTNEVSVDNNTCN
jgi:hypothetical protein